MAEQNKRVKYKFGQSELDLKNYIHNLGTNVQGYLNSKNWSEDQKQEFMNAHKNILAGFNDQLANNTNRFSTDDFGTITDTQGIISNKDNDDIDPVGSGYYYDNDGNRITTDDYNLLKDNKKKNYKAFSANREVASYFNTIGNALKQYTKPSEEQSSNNFDLSKHGFLPTWTSEQNPGGGDFDTTPYIEMDQIGEDGTRQTSKRAQYLKEQLTNYLNNLSNYNYENSPFKDEATYRQRLQEAINGLENGYNSEDTIALNRAGINNNFLKNFFSNGTSTEQQKTELQQQAEQAAKEMQERETSAQLQAVIDQNEKEKYETARNQYFADFQKNNPFQNTIKWDNIPLSYDRETMDKSAVEKFNADNTNMESVSNAIRQYIDFNQLSRLIRGQNVLKIKDTGEDITKQHIANNLDWAAQANLFLDPKYLNSEGKSILSDGYYVIPGSEDYDRWTFLAYNPQTRQYQEQSMLLNDLLKERMAYSEYDRRNKVKKNQLGGTLGWVQENQKKANETKEKENSQKEKAKNEDLTLNQIQEREKKLSEDLDGDDIARITSAALDLVSAGSAYIPVYGTAVSAGTGLASTLTNFGADMADEGTTASQMWRNLGFGLGMDAMGLIPGLGTGAKASKIARLLKPVRKGLMWTLNSMAIPDTVSSIPSFEKLFTNPSDLTSEDLRKITVGLQAVVGLHRGKRGAVERDKHSVINTSADVVNKGGSQSRISVDQLKELRKQKGYDKQNEYFKSITGGQELPKEFKHYNDPIVFRPFTRPFRSGPDVSISKETKLLPNTAYSWGIYKTTGKPIQSKPQNKSDKKVDYTSLRNMSRKTSELTQQEIQLINKQRVSQGKPKLTDEDIKNLNQRRKNRITTSEKGIKQRLEEFKVNKQLNAELNEELRQRKLGVPTNQGSLETPNANQYKFINTFTGAIPTITPSVKTINLPAIVPKPSYNINNNYKSNSTWNNMLKNVEAADKKRLGEQIGDIKTTRKVEEMSKEWSKPAQIYPPNSYSKPLSGAAYEAKQKMYESLPWNVPYTSTPISDKSLKGIKREGRKMFDEYMELLRGIENNKPYQAKPRTKKTKPKKTSKDDKRTVKRQDGGTLNLSNVRKLAKGDQVTNTTSKANWFNDMFSSDAMQKWIDAYTLNDYQKFNDLQKSWSANKKATQYVPGATPLDWNQGVQDRQKLWEQTGTNATIEDLVSRGLITRSGKSGDNAEGGHVDGYFGEQEYLRHGGTGDSWKGHEEELTKFQNMLKEKGLQYTLDPESGMYLMSPIKQNDGDYTIPVVNTSSTLEVAQKNNEDSNNKQDNNKLDIFSNILSNPTISYGLPRALYADRINRRITDMAKDAIVPLLKDPFEVHRYTRSDLDAEMQGVRNYAKLRNLANTNLTSDADKQKAYQFESESKGIDYINAGKEKSNQAERQYEELAWQQEKENAANRHETSMYNRAQSWAAEQDKSKLEQAYLSKKHNIWDVFGQQLEYDARQKLAETKAIRDNFARSDIHNSVMYNPNDYGANLTDEELQVWNQVLSGVQPSSLGNNLNKYISAQKKVSWAETEQLKQYYNIPNTKWSRQIQVNTPTYTPNISFVKKGGSLELAGIRAKTADAERFQKQIKECIDRNEEAINRLSKSMYGLLKSSIIK